MGQGQETQDHGKLADDYVRNSMSSMEQEIVISGETTTALGDVTKINFQRTRKKRSLLSHVEAQKTPTEVATATTTAKSYPRTLTRRMLLL